MSREQRRNDRKQQPRGAGAGASGAPPSRRTPVKVAGGSKFPSLPLAIAGGIVLVAALIAYLIWQSNQTTNAQTAWEKAAADRSTSLPGTYVEDQGRGHYPGGLSGSQVIPFCTGVPESDLAKERSGKPYAPLGTTPGAAPTTSGTGTAAATATPTDVPHGPTLTPTKDAAELTASAGSGTPAENATPTIPTDCHLSNPPSSGEHLNVQRNIDIGGGNIINIPADPDVYPDDIELPRESIAHILEHAGVFIGWNCADGDTACMDAVQKLKDLVNDRIDNHDDRAVMARDADLPIGTIGLSSWTRVRNLPATDYDAKKGEIADFISTHSCRYDPEGFCG
jgi:hypothetical protein